MMTFEQSIEQLEAAIARVESPDTPLEEALEQYKTGIALAKQCGEALMKYEAEVTLLQKEADGLFTLTPFGGEMVK
jgi:exodeoxyribonuclease VII small subunit